jgi:ribosomal protein L5
VGESVTVRLKAGNQIARFVEELFNLTKDFEGVLEITTTDNGVISMGLIQTGLVTTSIPTHHYGNWSQYN